MKTYQLVKLHFYEYIQSIFRHIYAWTAQYATTLIRWWEKNTPKTLPAGNTSENGCLEGQAENASVTVIHLK
jgi:hypothetical protein